MKEMSENWDKCSKFMENKCHLGWSILIDYEYLLVVETR